MTRKFIEQAAEEAGWECKIHPIKNQKEKWFIGFYVYTTLGQDAFFEFEVSKLEDIKEHVQNTYDDYDPEKEATLWYGQQGCPHDLPSLIKDMHEVDDMLEDLCITLNGGHISKPNEEVDFTRKANNLRTECLTALTSFSHKAKIHPGFNAKGYENPNNNSNFRWIIFLNYKWILLDSDDMQYDTECMPLEEFCEMVDAIINGKE